jgi:hypothetical protein
MKGTTPYTRATVVPLQIGRDVPRQKVSQVYGSRIFGVDWMRGIVQPAAAPAELRNVDREGDGHGGGPHSRQEDACLVPMPAPCEVEGIHVDLVAHVAAP